MQVPNHELVVVAARCELLVIEAPLKSTDLLLVAHQLAKGLALRADVPLEDVAVATPSTHDRLVPGDRTHATGVPAQRTYNSVMLCVPNLSVARLSSNSKIETFLGPSDRGDCIGALLDFAELLDALARGRPDVDGAVQAHCKDVLA